jgi:tripartite-type tricarboxylate transporter receptor subunit TctC
MKIRRILSFAALLGAILLLAGAPLASAQAPWTPTRPVRIIANAAGAVLDVAARQLAERLQETLGQPVLVENRPGAGGIAAMEATARSAPDGHTIAITTFVEMTVNPWMFDRLPYDPARDFSPVTVLYVGPQMLVAHPSFPANNLQELVRMAKGQPGRYAYGTSGVGRPPHIFGERFKHVSGIALTHVPFRGGPPLMQAVLAGEVPLAFEGTSVTVPQVKAGRLKAIAVTGDRRLAALPDVQTFAEAGIPGMGLAWVGLVAPAGTPEAAIQRLQKEIATALAAPNIRAAYDTAGRTPVGNSPEEFARMIRRELAEWRDVVKEAGIKPE